jgi:hypothetical protein
VARPQIGIFRQVIFIGWVDPGEVNTFLFASALTSARRRRFGHFGIAVGRRRGSAGASSKVITVKR